MRFSVIVLAVAVCLSSFAADHASSGDVWWEAEHTKKDNFPAKSFFQPQDDPQKDKLSGGTWLCSDAARPDGPLYATYEVTVPTSGTYNFWVRKFWTHGPFRWRFDSNAWQKCTRNCALADTVQVRPKMPANWVFLGPVELAEGTREFRFETTDEGSIGMDCFLLTRGIFMPRGKLQPGETSGHSEPGWFAWEPPADPLDDDCPIDLRYLNEAEAGQSGFVRRCEGGFELGDGTPVRFLEKGTINPHAHRAMVDARARRLAKYGVNMVRTGFARQYPLYKQGKLDEFKAYLDNIHYLIYTLKQQGIYTWIRLYWQTAQEAFFFDPEWREHYVDYARTILCTTNPYTGKAIADDPAVAVVAIQNENNLFFWTFKPENLEEDVKPLMERRFGEWAARKYGSIKKALEAWGPKNPPELRHGELSKDYPDEGRLGFYGISFLTGADWAPAQRNTRRASDQLQFMVEAQKGFYAGMVKTFRDELGLRNLIACSNWKTADPRILGVFEHYSYTPGDVVCKNIYYDVDYNPGPKRFYAVDVGDTFTPHSSLKPPELPEPFTIAHMQDMPYVVTESNWCRPNRYRVEWPFLFAAYGTMLGADGWSFNGRGGPLWNTSMQVWDVNSPSVLGQLPATALIYRRGDVQEAPVAVTDTLALSNLYNFEGVSIYGLKGKDVLWVSKIGDKESAKADSPTKVDPLAFFVGRVKRVITEAESKLETVDLDKYIDREKGEVRSLTGEVVWDTKDGVALIDTPRAQGACGFLKSAGPIVLSDVAIESQNEYGAVLVVSLDGEPLASSTRILIQAGTEDRTYSYTTEVVEGDRVRITDTGTYPLMVRDIDARVTLKGTVKTAQVLDGNGNLTGTEASLKVEDKAARVVLPANQLYTLVRR